MMELGAATTWAAENSVSLESLLMGMVDRDALARWPNPAYNSKEFSSYDRRSVSPDKPGWFANWDQGNYLRMENNQGRTEYVMMDADGSGAIVCFFKASTDPAATVRIYLDGAAILGELQSPRPSARSTAFRRKLLSGTADHNHDHEYMVPGRNYERLCSSIPP